MKYRHAELISEPGIFAVFTGAKYFVGTTTESEKEAEIRAFQMSAQWYRAQMDKAHERLQDLGAVDETDPYGYLA